VPGDITGSSCSWRDHASPGWGMDARFTIVLCKRNYCFDIHRYENLIKSDRNFKGILCLKKGCFPNDDDNRSNMSVFHLSLFGEGDYSLQQRKKLSAKFMVFGIPRVTITSLFTISKRSFLKT
jgi:hypothetical protein